MDHPITLFTVPRSFKGEIGIIQANAVESWRQLRPAPEILFISDDPGVAEAAKDLGCSHVPGVRYNDHGTPLVSNVFKKGQGAASHEIVSYINSDIVLSQSFSGVCTTAFPISPWAAVPGTTGWYGTLFDRTFRW